jgi:hypothetical protein
MATAKRSCAATETGLPAEALAKAGAPDRIRTCGLQIRNLSLYPTELRAHISQKLLLKFFIFLRIPIVVSQKWGLSVITYISIFYTLAHYTVYR